MRRKFILFLLALAVLVLFLSNLASEFFVDWLWFSSVGYAPVFWLRWQASALCFLLFFAGSFLFILANGYIAHRVTRTDTPPKPGPEWIGRGRRTETPIVWHEVLRHRLPWPTMLLLVSLFLGVVSGLGGAAQWNVLLKFLNQVPFNYPDPIFGKDVGFYLFSLPTYSILKDWLMECLALAFLLVVAVYWVKGAVGMHFRSRLYAAHAPIVHGSILLGLFFALKAWSYYLDRFYLLYNNNGVLIGANYTDIHLRLPVLNMLVLLSLATAVFAGFNVFLRRLKLLLVAIIALFGVSIVGYSILPSFYQSYVVKPNEFNLERPYIKNNIEFTQRAYHLSETIIRDFPAKTKLTNVQLQENAATVDNIRLWDHRPLLDTFKQLQSIRLYYDFRDVDIDRYYINGKYQQVMLSARELNQALIPETAQTWINLRFQFTHGYGLTMSPVTRKTSEGLPVFYIKDIPPVSSVDIKIDQPGIYYGEEADNYVIVKGNTEEFDYPKGKENAYTMYQGSGGVPIGSVLHKALFAWWFKDVNLLISNNVISDSRIMIYRNIRERVQKLAPFLKLDRDPYMVISQGKLYWIQDAYTVSSDFPYSQPINVQGSGEINYIRNSVKAVIDAYNGTVDFYVTETDDPITATYRRIFPTLFKDFNQMPEDLQRHIRYPEDLFAIQAELYGIYHTTDPQVFYNREDVWEFPKEQRAQNLTKMSPYYVIMRLPGETKPEFLLMLPMVPKNRDNMIAWLSARCDLPNYGKFLIYEFSKERLIYGPAQIEARIDQDTYISQQLTLWNQMGSKVIRGNLLVIPIDDAILYVEPIYLQAEHRQLPELKRVVASYEDKVVMEETLEAALARIFGSETAAPPPAMPAKLEAPSPAASAEKTLAGQALDHYNRAMELLKKGDWAGYGAELQALEKNLKALNEQIEKR